MPTSKYEANSGDIHQIRLDAPRLAVAGAPPGGAVSSDIKVKVSKTNREYGIRPRGVKLTRPLSPGPEEKIHEAFLPVLTPTAFATAAFQLQATITINGVQWKVVSRVNEDY